MNISKDNIDGVKNLPGTNVTSCIVPCTEDDNYATHDSIYGKGGWREVRTIEERNAIPMERRKLGMPVYVTQQNKLYILKYALNNACWYEFNPSDVSGIINDAISQGKVEVDFSNCVTQDSLNDTLVDYVSKVKSEEALEELEDNLKEWVNEKNYLTEHQSLENYATKEDVEVVDTKFDEKTSEIDDTLADFASDLSLLETKHDNFASDVNDKLTNMVADITELEEAIGGGEGMDFATKEELNELANKEQEDYETLRDNLSVVATTYVTQEMAENTYETKEQAVQKEMDMYAAINNVNDSLEHYAKVADIPTIIAGSGYITKSYLRGFATEFYVQDYVASVMSGKIKPGQPVIDYTSQITELQAKVAELEARVAELEG